MSAQAPLSGTFGSIKTRLAVLVGSSVLVAAVVGAVGSRAGVPLWLAVPATVALALVVTRWLAGGITVPLREMTAATERLSGGDYEVRLDTSRGDEVGELARSFSTMAAQIRSADEQRRRLVATVAHELRTPLSAQQALLENLVDGVVAPDDVALQRALDQSDRLTTLVGDLLDLSRADQGRSPLTLTHVPVRELLEKATDEAALQGRDVAVEVTVEPADLTVTADRGRLSQIITNLTDNALRHSPTGATVTITAADDGDDRWSLTVTDQGPGLSPGDAGRYFTRFGPGGDAAGGTGLGLAIAGWATSLHGGTIEALPPSPAHPGARVRATLPQEPTSTATPRPSTSSTPPPQEPVVPTTASTPPSTTRAPATERLSRLWPERDSRPQHAALLASVVVGVLAALLVPGHPAGIGLLLVLAAGGLTLWLLSPRRARPWSLLTAALALPLGLSIVLRADFGMALPALLAAGVLAATACTGASTVSGIALSAGAWVAAGLRGLPLLDRTLRAVGRQGSLWAAVRTTAISLVLLLVFGGLLASSDAVLGSWVSAIVPQISDSAVLRVFTLVFFTGVTLCGTYLAINPPAVEQLRISERTGWRIPFAEWRIPLLVVIATFVAWLAAQTASLVGGHDYVLRTTGVTYAQSAREGFGQLTLVTLLTIALVTLVRTWGQADGPHQQRWRTGLSAALCVLALLVVGSALHRMALYQEAYGWTVLRVGADLLELWFGAALLALLVSLFVGPRRWLGRTVLLTGVAAALVFSVGNVSAFVAERNIARYAETGKLDVGYLAALGDDASPTIEASDLPEAAKECALAPRGSYPTSWAAWNLARERAQDIRAGYDPANAFTCPEGLGRE